MLPLASEGSVSLDEYLAQVRRSLSQQRNGMISAIRRFRACPETGSIYMADQEELRAREAGILGASQIYADGWMLALRIVSNLDDHLAAIEDTSGPDGPRVFAHMTLARAALEGAARVAYLLDSSTNLDGRVLKAAFMLLASANEESMAVRDLEPEHLRTAAQARARPRLERIERQMGAAGITAVRARDRRLSGMAWVGRDSRVDGLNVTSQLRRILPHLPSAYRVTSGVTHSQPWVLDDDSGADPLGELVFDPFALAGSVDMAIKASDQVLQHFAVMLGHDMVRERRQATHRERAVSQLAGRVRA